MITREYFLEIARSNLNGNYVVLFYLLPLTFAESFGRKCFVPFSWLTLDFTHRPKATPYYCVLFFPSHNTFVNVITRVQILRDLNWTQVIRTDRVYDSLNRSELCNDVTYLCILINQRCEA